MAVSHPHDSTDTSVDVGGPDAHLSLAERGNMGSAAGKHGIGETGTREAMWGQVTSGL